MNNKHITFTIFFVFFVLFQLIDVAYARGGTEDNSPFTKRTYVPGGTPCQVSYTHISLVGSFGTCEWDNRDKDGRLAATNYFYDQLECTESDGDACNGGVHRCNHKMYTFIELCSETEGTLRSNLSKLSQGNCTLY